MLRMPSTKRRERPPAAAAWLARCAGRRRGAPASRRRPRAPCSRRPRSRAAAMPSASTSRMAVYSRRSSARPERGGAAQRMEPSLATAPRPRRCCRCPRGSAWSMSSGLSRARRVRRSSRNRAQREASSSGSGPNWSNSSPDVVRAEDRPLLVPPVERRAARTCGRRGCAAPGRRRSAEDVVHVAVAVDVRLARTNSWPVILTWIASTRSAARAARGPATWRGASRPGPRGPTTPARERSGCRVLDGLRPVGPERA